MLELALELMLKSADSNAKFANSSTGFVVVGRPPILNMFDIYLLIQSDKRNWPTGLYVFELLILIHIDEHIRLRR